MAKYVYDAWGNIISITDGEGNDVSNDPTHIANINPIRYRSYYYDRETNLYYLESRYYDPETGRFLNADNLGYMEPETVTGLNLYAYCGNNPIMYFDPTGHLFVSIVLSFIALGGIAYGTYKGVKAYQEAKESGATGVELFKETATAVVEGLVEGGIVGGLVGVGVATIATGGASFLGGTILAPALTSGGSVAVGGAIAVAGILGITAIGLTFASQNRPNNNGVQNKQFKQAAKKVGIDPKNPQNKDLLKEIHSYIRKNKLNLGWEELLELMRNFI